MRYPPGMRAGRLLPSSLSPDVSTAIPTVVPGNPHMLTAGRGAPSLDYYMRRPDANHNICGRGAESQRACKDQSDQTLKNHNTALLTFVSQSCELIQQRVRYPAHLRCKHWQCTCVAACTPYYAITRLRWYRQKSALHVHLLYLPAPLRIQIGRFGEVPDQLALNLLQRTEHMTEVDSQSKRREIARVAVLYGAVILHVALIGSPWVPLSSWVLRF